MAGMTVAVVGRATDPRLSVVIEAGVVTKAPCAEVEATVTEAGMTVAVKDKATEPGLAVALEAGRVTKAPSVEDVARVTAAAVAVAVEGRVAMAVEVYVGTLLGRMTAGGIAKVNTGVIIVIKI